VKRVTCRLGSVSCGFLPIGRDFRDGNLAVPLYHSPVVPRKTRGNPAEISREVKFLAIAREFCGNGNLNPAPHSGLES
jgi:hypothetical protein